MRNDHPTVVAAGEGDLDRLGELLAAEPESVNARGWMGITPLIAATWHAGSAAAVRLLLDAGADPLAVRSDGDGALHWAADGEVAGLLARAAGPEGLRARYLFDQTPLHVAVEKGYVEVVRAFLAAGADPAARDGQGRTPLDAAGHPEIARLLIEAGAPHATGRARTPLHDACGRAARDPDWVPVAELLLERGADPGRRDQFGALPSDLVGEHDLKDRLVAMVLAAGRSVDLTPAEAGAGRQEGVAVHPTRPEALTTTYCGTVLVRWRLAPAITPVEVIRVSDRNSARGPSGAGTALAFADRDSVWLREWDDPHRVRAVAPDLLPDDPYPAPVLSPDGRLLAVPACEAVAVVDLARGESRELTGFGDWSVVPRFAPDGRTLAVGNSMQGSWWLTVLDLDGTRRQERQDDLPVPGGSQIVSDVAFAPDGRTFATWVRPDHGHGGPGGYRGVVTTTRADTAAPVWHLPVDDDVTGAPGGAFSASLCYTPDGAWLAVGLDSGVLWLDAATGVPAGRDDTTGTVNALVAHPGPGVLAATRQGLRRAAPPAHGR